MRTHRTLGVIGLSAQVVFTIAWVAAPSWQGLRYDVMADSISDMYAETAPGGIGLVVILTACGAATIAYVLCGLLPELRHAGWTGIVAPVLMAASIFGVGDLLSPWERLACRRADSGCTSADQLANSGGHLDTSLSTAGIALIIAGAVLALLSVRRLPVYRFVAIELTVLTVILTAAYLVLAIAPGDLSGILERVLALTGSAVIGVLAGATIRNSAPHAAERPGAAAGGAQPS